MRALPRGRKATMAGVGALEVANLMRLGDKPPPAKDSDDGPATRTAVGPRPGSNAPPPVQPAPRAPAPPLPPPPAPLAAQLPPVPAPPDSNHPASASRRAAVRRGVAPRPQPMPEPARPMGRPLDAGAPEVPTRVGAEVPKALLDARPQPAEPDEDDTDAPTRTRDIASFAPPPMRGPAPAAPAARPAFSSANLPPPPALTGARAQARPTSLSTADSSEELPTNAIPLPLPEPMPDPPTETQTAVRVPSAAPAPAPPPAPLRGPSPAARAASRPPPPAPPDDDDEDEAAITGLREVPPAVPIPMPRAPAPLPPPPQARQASVRPPAQQAPPMPQPLVQPVVRGGTAAMDMTGLVPSAFPATPPVEPDDDDDDVPRTHILNATEALAAARVDPRSPHAHSRGFEQPQQQQPQQHHQQQQHQQHHQQQRSAPPAATSNAVQRGMMVGAGATASEGAAIPPPAPSFGAPPPSMRGAQQPQPQQQQPAAFAFAPPPGFGAPSRPVAMAPPPSPHENYAASLEQMAQQMPIQGANEQTSIGFGESPPMQQPIAPAAPIAAAPAPQGNFGPSPIRFVPSNPPPAAGRPVRLYIALALAVIAVASLVGYATYLLLASRRASSAEPILRDRHAEPSRPS
ncbi:MAG: hypothetical protein U0271_43540 [Polyangiaceae bacterium]